MKALKFLFVFAAALFAVYGDVFAHGFETATFTFAAFLQEKGVSDSEFQEKESTEQAALYTSFLEKANEKHEALINEKASKDDIYALKDEILNAKGEELKRLESAFLKQGEVLQAMKEELQAGKAVEKETIEAQIQKQAENMANIAKAKSGSLEFDLKANFTRSSITNSTDALRLSDIGQLATRKLVLYDLFPKIPVGANDGGAVRYTDWDSATTTRAAAARAEGTAFPESTATFQEYSMPIEKIGDTIPITEEALYDAARFTAELNKFLATNVSLALDSALYNGDGVSPNIKGAYTYASTFTAAASGITAPNIYDLVIKMQESMMKGKDSKYMPNVVLMNITDINKAKLTKDANENYVIPPFVNDSGTEVGGIIVLPSNNVTVNTCLMMDTAFGAIYEAEGFTINTGWINAQFSSDLVTLKAKKRCALLVRKADEGGFLKCTSISAALTTLAS